MNQGEEDGLSILTIIVNGVTIFQEINYKPYFTDQAIVTFTQPGQVDNDWSIKNVSIINGPNLNFTGKSKISPL